jgi:16S rRNA (uracil1498-N3)-methyltransferase
MAQIYRLFLPSDFSESAFLNQDASWVIDDKPTLHHVVTVQRLKVHQQVITVHPTLERARVCSVIGISKKTLELKPLDLLPIAETQLPEITLAMALIKEARWDWMLQKATELGVRTIQPLITEFTVVSPNNIEHKLDRWQAICQTAALQSEGLFIPTVLPPISLAVFLNQPSSSNTAMFVALERETETIASLKQALAAISEPITAFYVAVGAEGGWSEPEKALWQTASDRWQAVSLGSRILRAETAALFMIGAITYEHP